jgi:hypothetical protein
MPASKKKSVDEGQAVDPATGKEKSAGKTLPGPLAGLAKLDFGTGLKALKQLRASNPFAKRKVEVVVEERDEWEDWTWDEFKQGCLIRDAPAAVSGGAGGDQASPRNAMTAGSPGRQSSPQGAKSPTRSAPLFSCRSPCGAVAGVPYAGHDGREWLPYLPRPRPPSAAS